MELFRKTLDPVVALAAIAVLDIFLFLQLGAWTVGGGGMFRPPEELRQLYALAKVDPASNQIAFCNTGHWASPGWFVSSELLGSGNAALYDGSMVEWSADESLPMDRQVSIE